MKFERAALEALGFRGWRPFSELRQDGPPQSSGVYVVHCARPTPGFLDTNRGGWFKGKDPTVSLQVLEQKWVDGASVIYIGKANNLRSRLTQYANFGAGKPVAHWGGRLIWQISECDKHLVAWKETPNENPREVEKQMIEQFRKHYGKAPFANDPHRPGK